MTRFLILFFSVLLLACSKDDDTPGTSTGLVQLQTVKAGTTVLKNTGANTNIPVDNGILATFNLPLERSSVANNVSLKDEAGRNVTLTFSYLDADKTFSAQPDNLLTYNTTYTLEIGDLQALTGEEFAGITYQFTTEAGELSLENIRVHEQDLSSAIRIQNISTDLKITADFSAPLDPGTSFDDYITIKGKSGSVPLSFELSNDQKTVLITSTSPADYLSQYTFTISSNLTSEEGFVFQGFSNSFYTAIDSSYKFPEISEEALLTLVEEKTFNYFWDFAHPVSGLARERNTSGNLITIGGSGFGIMTIPVAIERGFITRQEGVDRIEKMVNFLQSADRFHGAWPHWMDGTTGEVIPFSTKDNGGDLVETAFMIQGLLTVRQYLNPSTPQEADIIATINALWESVEWDWYTKGGENVLYWHWSSNYEWEMNHQIQGWNEALIVYVLAASSPTHAIDPEVYHQGWARNGSIKNGNNFYDIPLPLGPDYGGPLFFAHYSFLGLDPRNLEDQYANYWTQNVNHSLINYQYVVDNPRDYVGYGQNSWGLTASDNQEGYSAHSPTNDLGVITPTAALSSMPYTPEHSINALKHFYYLLGDRLWGPYGFYDAFNPTEEWYADSYLAIDQGPIVVMIENYRTGLLWNLFMANPEIQTGLEKLGFTSY